MKDEKTIMIDINLTRGLVALLALALLGMALLGYLAWGRDEVAASGPQAPLASSAGMRQYYLTTDWYYGNEPLALDACASGYHMASLWEIMDPSNLKYNTELGYKEDDSGQGPPGGRNGWVRTGNDSSTSSTPGEGNCNTWESDSDTDNGTLASLPDDWTANWEDLNVWDVSSIGCNLKRTVWCVED